jgi:hypothetical protein
MQSIDYRRCCACGELSITMGRRFLGGSFFATAVPSLAIAFAVTRF